MHLMKIIGRYLGIYGVWFRFFEKNYLSDRVDIKGCLPELKKYNPDIGGTSIHEYSIKPNQINVSVIVPAYNVQKYIGECLQSLLAQKTSYKYEIIVVNDGSTDNTLKIINSIKCDFLRVIDKPNRGISSARNIGIKNAFGEYLIFCDADDYMAEKAIQLLIDTAKKTNADIVEGSYRYVSETGKLGKIVKHKRTEKKQIDTFGVPWCKCIKKSLFQNICFPSDYWFEDSIIHQMILPMARRIEWIDDVLYYYRTNSNGATSVSAGNPKSVDSLWIAISLFNDRNKLKIPKSLDYYKYMLNMLRLGFHRTRLLPENIRKDFYYVYASFLSSNFDEYEFGMNDWDFTNMQRLVTNVNYDKYCDYFNRT